MVREQLEAEYLGALTIKRGDFLTMKGAPSGTRMVGAVVSGRLEGPRLQANTVGPGGDWATRRPDGTLRIDVRLQLRTDDGADILVTYQGVGNRVGDKIELRTAPLFEVADERYAWLNGVQAVGYGDVTEDGVIYELYALR